MIRIMPRLVAVCAVAVSAVLLSCREPEESPKEPQVLVIASYGGSYQESQRAALFAPFEKSRGVRIRDVTHTGEYSKITGMVQTGNYEWDIVDVESPLLYRGARENMLEKIDYAVVPKKDLLPWAAHDYGVANVVYSNVIAYSTKAFPAGGAHPQSWQEFWDVKRFPGRRALRKNPIGTLEIALMADGVAPESLYPLDVERAFKSLERIKPHVHVWWESGAQPPQLLGAGEVALSSAYNGRVWSAAHDEKLPVAVEWGQGLLDSDWWTIPRGLPEERRKLAMEFIAFAIQAERQAEQTKYIAYGPSNLAALNMVSDISRPDLPTAPDNLAKQVRLDAEWWAENEAKVLERWNKWRIE